jgi:hypothetical protein
LAIIRSDVRVRHVQERVVERAEARAAQADLFERGERPVELDQVAPLERAVGHKDAAAQHVRNGIAGGEGDGDAAHAEAGQHALVG